MGGGVGSMLTVLGGAAAVLGNSSVSSPGIVPAPAVPKVSDVEGWAVVPIDAAGEAYMRRLRSRATQEIPMDDGVETGIIKVKNLLGKTDGQ